MGSIAAAAGSLVFLAMLLGFLWIVSLLPWAAARALARRMDHVLGPAGLAPASGVSLPRLRLWRGEVAGREVVARVTLRSRLMFADPTFVLAVRSDGDSVWDATDAVLPDNPAVQEAVRALAAPHAHWMVSSCPGWVVLSVDTLQAALRLDAPAVGESIAHLVALAETLEEAGALDDPRWDPSGLALPGALVWGVFLLVPALCTLVLPPLLAAVIAAGTLTG